MFPWKFTQVHVSGILEQSTEYSFFVSGLIVIHMYHITTIITFTYILKIMNFFL